MEQGYEEGQEKAVSLGIWEFPSGTVVEVFLSPPDAMGARHLRYRWERGSPSDQDLAYYKEVLRHEIYARAKEYMEAWRGITAIEIDDPLVGP